MTADEAPSGAAGPSRRRQPDPLAAPHSMHAANGNSAAAHHAAAAKEWREYVSGGGAAFTAIILTFPINKGMFRQQVHNISPVEAFKQLKREGAVNLYRGVISPLLMKTMSNSVMFGSYTQYSRILREKANMNKTNSRLLGAIAAGASEATLMPLERVQVLMQDQKYHSRYRNTLHAFYTLRVHGAGEYYRGLVPILLRNCPGNMIFFTGRERIQTSMPESWTRGTYSPVIVDFVSGACLGAFISTCFFPVNVTKTHMQLVVGGKFLRLRTVAGKLLRERGARGMFRGVHVNYTRSFLSWGIVNVTYEKLLGFFQTIGS